MHLFKGTISVVLTVAYFACILVSGSILDLSKVHHELKGLSEPLRFQQRVSSCPGDVSDTSSSNCEVVTYLSDFMQLKAKVLKALRLSRHLNYPMPLPSVQLQVVPLS